MSLQQQNFPLMPFAQMFLIFVFLSCRLPCPNNTAALLASYAVQCEYCPPPSAWTLMFSSVEILLGQAFDSFWFEALGEV